MAENNDGGPAFPIPTIMAINGAVHDFTGLGGMTLRDYFAGQAMAYLSADPDSVLTYAETAIAAYGFADAMLAARNRPTTPATGA